MYYGSIKDCDIADGPGVRVSLFVSGCRNHCKGCFQPETWDFEFGQEFTKDTEAQIVEMLKPDYIAGLTILGGDPFEPENQCELVRFVPYINLLYPKKDIWIYTGYTWEDLVHGSYPIRFGAVTEIILQSTDILVDGPFIEAEKDISLRFRGSSNQRIINVRESLLSKGQNAVLAEEYYTR